MRDKLIDRINATQETTTAHGAKEVAYLSLEFLMGRALQNTVCNLGLMSEYAQAIRRMGYSLEDLCEEEPDAGLGNGGLGRLAACFMDSLATLDYPAWGYGLRYNYGIFTQKIVEGFQVEVPDNWLEKGYPWEIGKHQVLSSSSSFSYC